MELHSNDQLLQDLSKSAGVDFLALRKKYSSLQPPPPTSQGEKNHGEQAKKDMETLEKYKICQGCSGTGIQKSIYNFRVVESDCEVCEGECITMRLK